MNKEKYKRRSNIEEERQMLELDFGDMPDICDQVTSTKDGGVTPPLPHAW